MDQLINTTDYTILELILAALGAIGWVIAYLITIRNIRKYKFVEMPVFCATGNIAWEFLWGFVFYDRINMGEIYVWSYRAWFLIDIYIFYSVIKYGYKQFTIEAIRKHARPILIGLTVAFFIIIYAFVKTELDNPMGAQTSYLLNFGISILYITSWLRLRHTEVYSKAVAWAKMLGTLMYSIYFFLAFPWDYAVTALSSAVFILDIIYIWMIYNFEGGQPKEPAMKFQNA